MAPAGKFKLTKSHLLASHHVFAKFRSLIDLFTHVKDEKPNHTCLLWPDTKTGCYVPITLGQLWNLGVSLCQHLKPTIFDRLKPKSRIGVISSNQPNAFLLWIAILQANMKLVLLPDKLTQSSLQSFIQCSQLQALVIVEGAIPTHNVPITIPYFSLPAFELDNDIFRHQSTVVDVRSLVDTAAAEETICLRTSGSISAAKAVWLSTEHILGVVSRFIRIDDEIGVDPGHFPLKIMTVAPYSHAICFYSQFLICLSGVHTSVLPLGYTPDAIRTSIKLTNPTVFLSFPLTFERILKAYEIGPTEWKEFEKIPLIYYCGASMRSSLLRTWQEKNVRIRSLYGSTEAGLCLYEKDQNQSGELSWVKGIDSSFHMEPFDKKNGLYQLGCTQRRKFSVPSTLITTGNEYFASADLFSRGNPGISGNEETWTFAGRIEDILIDRNGRRLNALRYALLLEEHCLPIERAVVVRFKEWAILVVVQIKDLAFDALSYDEIERNVNEASRTVTAETILEEIVRDFLTIVYILPKGKLLPVGDKGNVSRSGIAKTLVEEIERMENTKLVTHPDTIREIVREIVSDCVQLNPGWDPNVSFLQRGIDRFSARVIVEMIADKIGVNITPLEVYDNGTLNRLADYVAYLKPSRLFFHRLFCSWSKECRLVSNSPKIKRERPFYLSFEKPKFVKDCDEIWERCSAALDELIPLAEQTVKLNTSRRTILITGATGSLGIQLIQQFVESGEYEKILCLFRGGDSIRLRKIAEEKELDMAKWASLVECYNLELIDDKLGLNPKVYTRLESTVTDIVHCAWRMGFRTEVKKFERDCLKSLLSIIRFSLSKTLKRVWMISSITSVGNYTPLYWTKENINEENFLAIPEEFFGPDQVYMTVSIGYGLSKYLAERVCLKANETLGAKTKVLRCGVISGDTKTGQWALRELIPILITLVRPEINTLPEHLMSGICIPADIAAAAINDVITEKHLKPSRFIYHISHPQPLTWPELLAILKQIGLNFDVTSWRIFIEVNARLCQSIVWTWSLLQRLMKSQGKGSVVKPLGQEVLCNLSTVTFRPLAISETMKYSKSLRECSMLDSSLIEKYLVYWNNLMKEN